jgi:CubicO group peptidase (beta-lactamase class C family)
MNLLRRCFNNRLRLFADLKDWKMIRTYALTLAFVFVSSLSNAQDSLDDQTRAMIARASSLELKTKSVPPPGDPLEHHAAGFAKILCSAVFVTGLEPEFAAENIGYFTAPYEERANMKWRVDRENKAVHVTLPNGVTRTAKFIGDLGCLTLPRGETSPFFELPIIESGLPDAATTQWPMGDVLPGGALPADLDATAVAKAVDAAFEPEDGLTAACVVTWKGRIIGERYRNGITMHTSLESWSMGKSLTATLLGTLIKDGVYALNQPAPIPEWQNENDPRRKIRIADILHMSSGLRFRAPHDPDFDPAAGYPDHRYVYTGAVNSFEWAVKRPLQWAPNTVGRYRNSDPVTANYLIRLAVEKRGGDYHSFPQRSLFDKLGMRDMVLETDPYGNFLLQGYEFGSARDWSRLGNLYLQDGVWNEKRLLPEGFVDFVSTLAPAWVADGRPIYGGFFWINGTERFPIPKDAYYMAGAGGQYTIIIPSHDLVVVRMGHYKGSSVGFKALNKSLALLMQIIPERQDAGRRLEN